MADLEDLTKVIQLLLTMGALIGAICGGILWAIKLCVERLLLDIKEEISGIKNIISNHTIVHSEHSEKIEELLNKTADHEVRLFYVENTAKTKAVK